MTLRLLTRLPIALLAVVLNWGLVACSDDDDDNSGTDGDTDTDTGTGSEVCTAPFEWGSSLIKDHVVGNWTFNGYIDADGDGVVEQEAVDFDLELIHCTGKQSLVLAMGDTS